MKTILWLTCLGLTVLSGTLAAAPRSSTHYGVPAEAVNSGGGAATGGLYANTGSVGLIVGTQTAASPAVEVQAGFITEQGVVVMAPEIHVSVTSLSFGSVNLGTDDSLQVVIRNQGTEELLMTSSLSGADQGDFAASAVPASLAAGGQVNVTVTFTPSALGDRAAALVITSNDDDEGTLNIALTGTGIDVPEAVIAVQPLSQLVPLGGAAVFNPVVTGVTPMTFQWKKGTTVIKNATQSDYTIQMTKATDAGAYSLVADNAAGPPATSQPAYLGVVTPMAGTMVIKKGAALSLKATVAASTGAKPLYAWRRGLEVLTNSPPPKPNGAVVTGADKAALSITKMGMDDAGTYSCLITLDTPGNDPELVNGEVVVRVVDAAPTMQPVLLPVTAYVGQVIDTTLLATNYPTGFTVTGLPAGLKVDAKTGRITGQPTTASKLDKLGAPIPSKIVCKATNPWATGLPVEHLMTILPLPPGIAGGYTGLVARDTRAGGTGELGGMVTLKVTGNSVATGKLTLLGKAVSFTSSLRTAVDGLTGTVLARLTFPRLPAGSAALVVDMTLTVTPATRVLSGELAWTSGAGGFTTLLSGLQHQTVPLVTGTGLYNSALLTQAPAADLAYPQGTGYLILTISTAGVATWGGKLSDNTTITGSSSLGPQGQVPVHLPLYVNTGSVHGWAQISGSLVDGTVDWQKAPQPVSSTTRSYKGGFSLHDLTVEGGKYTKPATGARAIGLTEALHAVLTDGGLADPIAQPVTLTTGNVFQIPANAINLKLGVNTATGLITGSFTQPGLKPATPRKADIFGAMIPGSDMGTGFFNLSENPDAVGETPANTPLHSGAIKIQAP